ncbi:Uncharacterised protein [Klebsiella pneumoniae]|nr:Uncharacterised protein [Klebsiella pneumoniae]
MRQFAYNIFGIGDFFINHFNLGCAHIPIDGITRNVKLIKWLAFIYDITHFYVLINNKTLLWREDVHRVGEGNDFATYIYALSEGAKYER